MNRMLPLTASIIDCSHHLYKILSKFRQIVHPQGPGIQEISTRITLQGDLSSFYEEFSVLSDGEEHILTQRNLIFYQGLRRQLLQNTSQSRVSLHVQVPFEIRSRSLKPLINRKQRLITNIPLRSCNAVAVGARQLRRHKTGHRGLDC